MGFGDNDAVRRLAEAEPEVASLVAESAAFPSQRLIDPYLARPGQASAQHARSWPNWRRWSLDLAKTSFGITVCWPPTPGTERPSYRAEGALLMTRVFAIDPLRCSCGGRLRLVAMVMDGAGAERYLRGTGPTTEAQRARPPPVIDLDVEARA